MIFCILECHPSTILLVLGLVLVKIVPVDGGGGGGIPIDPGGGEVMDKFVHSRDVVQKYYD